MSVRAIYHEEKHIGEKIKKTKTQFIFKFELDGLQHQIEFLVSKLTGKKKVIQDGEVILEQQKLAKNFQFPFNIGKHMLNLSYGLKGAKLRIDNVAFEDLYQSRGFKATSMPSGHKRPEGGRPKASTTYAGKKNITDGWSDIQRAKDSVKYDDIPDPYAQDKKGEKEAGKFKEENKQKQKTSLRDIGKRQKSSTVKEKKSTGFGDEDEFDWGDGDSKKQSSNNDAFDFDFGTSSTSDQNKKSDAFDFDSFGQELSKPTSSTDPFADMEQPKASGSTGLEDVIFDNELTKPQNPPSKQQETDIFSTDFTSPTPPPSNPFAAFTTPPVPQPPRPQQDPFSHPTSTLPPPAGPTTFGGPPSQSSWSAGFSNGNFSNDPFSEPGAFESKLTCDPNKDFASLNPFGGNGFSK
ncbi:unnamed protein product [Moneuplotes crassus]|uniref:Uncharacterized protein n=1 Tax=Euplotes crassus TaxID=5936 RepID=A0AAD1UBF7_EUPCR|nr:unnamed protein product [Moneuplotes crassus]